MEPVRTSAGDAADAGLNPLETLDELRHTPLFGPHRVPHDLGRVGSEDQPDVEVPQQGFEKPRRYVQGPQALEQALEGGRFILQWPRAEVVRGGRGGVEGEGIEIAVFFDVLFEDVDQLEVERERPGRRDGVLQIHLNDQPDDLGRCLARHDWTRSG